MNSLVCTLYEGDYEVGVGALINSLVNNNFTGKIVVGHKGNLPTWLSSVTRADNSYFVGND